MLRPLFNPLVACITPHPLFFSVQQLIDMSNIVNMARRCRQAVNQSQLIIYGYTHLHAEVPFVSFLDLMHLGITRAFLVLSG